jgi:hypothetical protein
LVALTSRGFPAFNFTREILTVLHSLHCDSSIVRGCKVVVWGTDIYIVKRSFAIICKHFKNYKDDEWFYYIFARIPPYWEATHNSAIDPCIFH